VAFVSGYGMGYLYGANWVKPVSLFTPWVNASDAVGDRAEVGASDHPVMVGAGPSVTKHVFCREYEWCLKAWQLQSLYLIVTGLDTARGAGCASDTL
jgi:hypothetical protein